MVITRERLDRVDILKHKLAYELLFFKKLQGMTQRQFAEYIGAGQSEISELKLHNCYHWSLTKLVCAIYALGRDVTIEVK